MRRLSFVFLVFSLTSIAAHAITISRGPYLGRPDDQSVAVIWRTDVPADSRVDYALLEEDEWKSVVDTALTTQHTIRISDLAPGVRYRYRIYANGIPLDPTGTFRAPRSAEQTRFEFAIVGDTATQRIPAAIAQKLATREIDFTIHTGDVVYPVGSDALYDQELFAPMSPLLLHAPLLPTLGNHDVLTGRGAPLLANFVLPRNPATNDSRFYAFRQGNALLLALDIETSPFGRGSKQYEWARELLASSDATWKFVYFHEPPYSSHRSHAVARLILTPLFEHYGVDIVFNGSAHLYERTKPIRAMVSDGSPVIYVTEGGGGARLSQVHREEFSEFVRARFGFTLVSIDGSRLRLESHDLEEGVIDTLILEKTGARRPRGAARR